MTKFKNKGYKTAIFMTLDTMLVFLLTWIWYNITHKSWIEKLSHGKQAIAYTIYITFCFGIYYYIFELYWKYIKTCFQ